MRMPSRSLWKSRRHVTLLLSFERERMTEYWTWLGFGKALLAGGLAYLGMLLVQAAHGRTKPPTRRRLETALAAALGAVIAVMVMSSSYAGFLGGALALGAIVLVHLGVVRHIPGPTAAPREAPPVLLLYRGEVVEGALEAADLSEDQVARGLRAVGIERNEQVAALVLEEAGTLRLFFADARPPALWKRNGKGPSGRGRGEA